jgi:threonine/homoserine/homoserine lactone efflux protein
VREAVGQILAFGLAVGLSPIPIIGITLMLTTPKARSNGPAFLAGWIIGLAGIGTLVLLIAGGADASEQGNPATWVGILKLVLGVGLIGLALRRWRSDEEKTEPAWMKSIDSLTAARAAGLGFALSALNPKNLLLTVAAGASIAQAGTGAGAEAVAMAVFVLIGTLGTGIPVSVYFAMGERAEPMLGRLRAWMARHNSAIVSVVLLLIGAKLLGDGIGAL